MLFEFKRKTPLKGRISEQLMGEGILPADPILLADLQAPPYEVSRVFRYFWGEGHLFVIYSVDQLEFILGWPRRPPVKHFVVNQAD